MRYRNIVLDKTVVLEAKLKAMEFAVQRQQPVGEFMKAIADAREIIEDIQGYIDREERTPGEINTGINR